MLTRGMLQIAVAQRLTLALAVTLVLAGCSSAAGPSSAPVATSTNTPATAAAGTTAPATPSSAPSSSVAPTTWQPLDLFPEADGPYVPALIASDASGFLIAATDGRAPRIWSSADGIAWTAEALPTISQANPSAAAAGVDRTVLAGGGEGQCAHPVFDLTWARPAGGGWAVAPFQPIFCAGGQPAIATDGRTFVVAGTGAGDQPFLWSSEDGLTWANVSVAAEIMPTAIVWTGSEYLILARGPTGFSNLTSPDGANWDSTPASGLPDGFPRLFELSGNTVALIAGPDRSLVAYQRQADGSWHAAATTGLQAPADDVTTTTSSGGLGFVFLSTTAAGGTVLASADGLAWHAVPTPNVSRFIGVATFGDRAVLVGSMDTPDRMQALAWWGPASLLRGG